MADNERKPTTKEFLANDQANYYLGITSIKVNGKNAYELKGKFLDDLHNNAFSRTSEEDAVEHIEYFLRIDQKWYDELTERKLKGEALTHKARIEEHEGMQLLDQGPYANAETKKDYDPNLDNNVNNAGDTQDTKKEHHDPSVYNIRIFEMIKYLFGQDEEYVAVKEDEYEDLRSTSKYACRAYQEIFRMMNEGWMVTKAERSWKEKSLT
ncbi:hypothetical protein Tco_1018463 [Tanacetum coccineum]|uniref:Uncharacterized protein n=1 Tax=Tanacetum coccineum TaxID=301880 RepID=A0ABQ5FVU7_9ASTR